MSITSTGLSSGLDVETIVSQLVLADVSAPENRLDKAETNYQSRISAYGLVKGAVSDLKNRTEDLTDPSIFGQKAASSSDDDVLGATALNSASPGSYSVEVTQLAEAQALASSGYDATSTEIGKGTLTLKMGTTVYDPSSDVYSSFTESDSVESVTIVIDDSNKTLAGIRDAINASGMPVTAGIIYDGSGYRLTVSADNTGTTNTLSISVSGDDDGSDLDNSGLSALRFDANGTNLTQTTEALDANLTVNGLSVSSSSNSNSLIIEGVTLNLKSTTSAPVTISVIDDIASARDAVEAFVSSFNGLQSLLNAQSSYDAEAGRASVLTGDSTLRTLAAGIRSKLNAQITNANSALSTLPEIGISSSALTGLLTVDQTKLSAALEDPLDVATVLSSLARSTGSNVEFVSSGILTEEGDYAVSYTTSETAGSLTGGTVSAGNFNNISLDFTIEIDGVSQLIQYVGGGGNPTLADVATGLESAIDTEFGSDVISVAVNGGGDALVFTSTTTGSASSVAITGSTGADDATLGITVATGTAGTSISNATIGGEAASIDGNVITGPAGTIVEGLSLRILGGASGDLGSVSFSKGLSDYLSEYLEGILADDGLIDAKLTGLAKSVDDIEEQRITLERRASALESRYRAQFTALETLIAQINTTQSFLNQALQGFVEPLDFKK